MLISCEENNGAGKGRVREMMMQRMVWGRGGGGKFFRVEGRVREHSCLPTWVSTAHILSFSSRNSANPQSGGGAT